MAQNISNIKTATKLMKPCKINGVNFDGSQDITITATDPTVASQINAISQVSVPGLQLELRRVKIRSLLGLNI